MKRFFRDDIEYRIANLRFAINDLIEADAIYEDVGWEKGYRDGRLTQMESELRFLEGLVNEVGHVEV